MSLPLAQLILGFILFQRLGELALAHYNTRRLLTQGGVEHGAEHYPFLVVLHGGWLAALVLRTPLDAPVDEFGLALFVLLQVGRLWVLTTLGPYWTTRIITVPGAPLIRSGPYRYLKHPNYAVVAGEIAVVPLMLGDLAVAVVFSGLNALLLAVRIRAENAALANRRDHVGG